MAACGSIQHIFDNPLPENPSLFDPLTSWTKITTMKPVDQSSITELFGELHFKEPSSSSSSSSSFPFSSFLPKKDGFDFDLSYSKKKSFETFPPSNQNCHKTSDGFSSMNSESLQLCTEGLGFESSDDVEDLRNEMAKAQDWQNNQEETKTGGKNIDCEEKPSLIRKHFPMEGVNRKSRTNCGGGSGVAGGFPPPISSIGKSGKPWVFFKSYREDGRFVLKEIRVPMQEFLHACREDGRLTLHFVQPTDENLEDEDEETTDSEDEPDEENEG